MMLTRAELLRLGGAALAGSAVPAVGARAALPTPTPKGDDEGFLEFGAITERTALTFYRTALKQKGVWSATERRGLSAAVTAKQGHVQKLTAALGADAPSTSDFAIELPKSAFASRAGALKLGRNLEGLLVGVYVGAVAFTADPASRLLLGRVLSSDAQQAAWLDRLAGVHKIGLPDPIDLETAGTQLDAFLQAKGYPTD